MLMHRAPPHAGKAGLPRTLGEPLNAEAVDSASATVMNVRCAPIDARAERQVHTDESTGHPDEKKAVDDGDARRAERASGGAVVRSRGAALSAKRKDARANARDGPFGARCPPPVRMREKANT